MISLDCCVELDLEFFINHSDRFLRSNMEIWCREHFGDDWFSHRIDHEYGYMNLCRFYFRDEAGVALFKLRWL